MNKPSFYPPQRQDLLIRLIQSISYPVAHCFFHLELEIEQDSLDKLRALRGERLVLLPNHSTFDDAISMFLLLAKWGDLSYYLVARDAFTGFLRKFLPWMGSYSIQRGVGDRASIAQTLNLLQQPGTHLTIFPEGGCSFQNDTVMPFRTGAIQLPLQAMGKIVKSEQEVPNLYLVPVSMKYHYQEDMTGEIEKSLKRLEDYLGIVSPTPDVYQRLQKIGEQIIIRLEKEYGLKALNSQDWNQRLNRIKAYVLELSESKLDIPSNPQIPDRERVYKIQSVLEDRAQNWTEAQQETYQEIKKAIFRLLNFDAIYYGYVADSPTPERYLDTLTRLEREIFEIDQPKPKAHRKVYIRIGDPINLKDHYEDYRQNKGEVVEKLTLNVQNQVQENLDWLNQKYILC